MKRVKPTVKLVRFTPAPEEMVAAAAKLCYAAQPEQIFDQDQAESAAFVNKLKNLGHMSPFEHAVFTFYIEGVSRAMTHQLVRHRLASYSQRSQRYISHDHFDFVMPPQFEGKTVSDENHQQIDAVAYYEETMRLIAERYARLNDALGRTGESSNEDARYVLPNACETKIVATMNARELMHFLEERLCLRAQWEIRQVAEIMLELAKNACPDLFRGLGPKCIRHGSCPEGKMTCGQYQKIKKQYAADR